MKIKINNILYFCIIYILIQTNYYFNIYKNDTNLKYINTSFIFFFTCIFFFKNIKFFIEMKKKESIILIFTLFLRKFYIGSYIIIFFKVINKKKRLKIILFVLIFFYILTILLNYFGIFNENISRVILRKFEDFSKNRYTLGFAHPNTAMSLLLPIFFLIYYLYYDRTKILISMFIFIIGKIVFNYTYSRTTFLLILLFIFLILVNDKYIEKLKKIFLLEGGITIFFTFFLPYYFRNTFLNKLLSGRLILFYNYLTKFQITLFGNKEIIGYYKIYPLDNVYLRILFENGIIGFILLIILIFYIMKILFKNKDYKAIRIFSIVLIFGVMEGSALNYYLNIIYFIIPDYIFIEKE